MKKRVSYASKERYVEVLKLLEPTTYRLQWSLDEYIKSKPKASTKVPSVCIECKVKGFLHLHNLMSVGAFQACLCNKQLRWDSESGRDRLDTMIIESRFDWCDPSNKPLKLKSDTILNLKCSICNENLNIQLLRFVHAQRACGCSNRWSTFFGRARIDALVEESRFDWKDFDNRHDGIHDGKSRLQLVCSICTEEVSPEVQEFARKGRAQCGCEYAPAFTQLGANRINKAVKQSRFEWPDGEMKAGMLSGRLDHFQLVCGICKETVSATVQYLIHGRIGCGCKNGSELDCVRFIRDHCSRRGYDNLLTRHNYRFDNIRGHGNLPVQFDCVVFDLTAGGFKPILFVEVDGPHHFDRDFCYAPNSNTRNRAFEHDVIREDFALNNSASMARIHWNLIKSNKGDWKGWLADKIDRTVSKNLDTAIYHAALCHDYVSGEYARLRPGICIDSNVVKPIVDQL